MPNVPARGPDGAPDLLRTWGMRASFTVGTDRRALHIARDPVCVRCGHGESLHPQRDLACLACDQRASLGIRSHFCVGFLSDLAETVSRAH